MLDHLLTALRKLEDAGVPVDYDDESKNDIALLHEIEGYANAVLVTCEGRCDYKGHTALTNAGYPVFCAERDSFGWLRGGIRTKVGAVYYG